MILVSSVSLVDSLDLMVARLLIYSFVIGYLYTLQTS